MNGIMKIASVLVLIFLGADTLYTMSWPSEDAVLTNNFGSNNNGMPVLGMIFNGGTDIIAAEKGEVIFSRNSNDAASRLPSPLGAWTAIDHGDGLISIYSRYAEDSERQSISRTYVEKSQSVASSGISGWSARKGFYFSIFDRRERHWINPAMIITPVQSNRPPQILSVNLRNAQGQIQTGYFTQGRYKIFVNAVIPQAFAANNFLVPQKIICLVNGSEIGSLNFEAFSARDGILMIYRNGLVPARQIYSAFPAFEAAEVFLTRGQVNMEIIVQDIAGNSRNYVNRFIVN